MKNPEVSIVLPAYNEKKSIVSVLKGIIDVMKKTGINYELIVVDDGSKDGTAKLAEKYSKVYSHDTNRGYGAALKTGARKALAKQVLYFDADNQHDPKDILKVLKHLGKYDMVIGARQSEINLRKPAKIALNAFSSYVAGRNIPDINSGFRLIRKEIIMDFMNILPNAFSFTTTITLAAIKSGYSLKYVPITVKKRIGKSKIAPVKDAIKFILYIMRMSMLFSPLKIFLPISALFFIISSFYGIFEVVVTHNISDTTLLLSIATIQIFLTGLIADQISHMRRRV